MPEAATATASSTYNVFSAIASSDQGSGDVGTSPASYNAAGASGSSDGSMNLSNGATIAIVVAVVVVVILGAISAALFYIAKKRQWDRGESLRRSGRRVAGADRPKTSRNLQSAHGHRVVRIDPPSRLQKVGLQPEEKTQILEDQRRDVEQGHPTRPEAELPAGMQSSFDMDSPRMGGGAGWSRMFGRRE